MKNVVAIVLFVVALGVVGARMGLFASAPPKLEVSWPPVKGQAYPDLELQDAVSGRTVKLSSLRGKVLLIEPIGLACPGCNAYAGAEVKGGFRGAAVQRGLGSLEDHLRREAGIALDAEPELVLVQLLLFDTSSSVGNAPTFQDAKDWAAHFELVGRPNVMVLCGTTPLANGASYNMVPGFQVVDKQGVLRWDGTGHHPVDDPYAKVLASIPELLRE